MLDRGRRDVFFKDTDKPHASTKSAANELLFFATCGLLGFAGIVLAFVAGYGANEKPPRTVVKYARKWRFVDYCSDKDRREQILPPPPQSIPRTNPSAEDLLFAPNYPDNHASRAYSPKGYSRGRPRNLSN